jgi:glycosyltransferase involved in cell wall biosynthesis
MLSVIIPVYNTAAYLKRCVDSILAQTYNDLEIILVDDGSTDDSPKMCDDYAAIDKRIKVVHQRNGGLAAARNGGLAICTGKYVTFVDSDDYVNPQAYELVMPQMNDQIDLAIFGHRLLNETDSIPTEDIDRTYSKLSEDELWREIFGRLNNAAWNKIYRADLIADNRFPLKIVHGEDLLFNLQYLTKCKNALMFNAKLYYYIKREGSITTSSFSPKRIYEITAKDKALEIVKQYKPELIPDGLRYCFRARLNLLRSLFKAKRYYNEYVPQCQKYIDDNFKSIAKYLNRKDIVEYMLFRYFRFGYKLFVAVL